MRIGIVTVAGPRLVFGRQFRESEVHRVAIGRQKRKQFGQVVGGQKRAAKGRATKVRAAKGRAAKGRAANERMNAVAWVLRRRRQSGQPERPHRFHAGCQWAHDRHRINAQNLGVLLQTSVVERNGENGIRVHNY